jgi:hypothetical protein
MSRFLSTLTCVAVLTAGCGANPNDPGSLPVTLTLQVGQTASAGGLGITFLEVSNDWRCPIDAICISAGDAYLQLAVTTSNRTPASQLQLQVEHPQNRSATFEGYSLTVQSLGPYPSASNPIDKSQYKVTLEVSR